MPEGFYSGLCQSSNLSSWSPSPSSHDKASDITIRPVILLISFTITYSVAGTMLHIILLDCALELVPKEISSIKEIQSHASRRRKKTTELLLDQSYHGRAITRLENGERRGRPDIVYLSLHSILETPLCKQGLLTIHLHLQDGRIIDVKPEVRLPRNYDRFVGLMEQLLLEGKVPPNGPSLISISESNLSELLTRIVETAQESFTFLASEDGEKYTIDVLDTVLPADSEVPVVIGIGAFPHGNFSKGIKELFDIHIQLDKEVMMAWHVCSEFLWSYSRKVRVVSRRYSTT